MHEIPTFYTIHLLCSTFYFYNPHKKQISNHLEFLDSLIDEKYQKALMTTKIWFGPKIKKRLSMCFEVKFVTDFLTVIENNLHSVFSYCNF